MIYLKRVYEEALETDGYRVLIDRLWPRGMKKERVAIDCWAKELTPSNELRKWYHQFKDQQEFSRRYLQELDERSETQDLLQELANRSQTDTITLVYAAKDQVTNHGVILLQLIESQFNGKIDLVANRLERQQSAGKKE